MFNEPIEVDSSSESSNDIEVLPLNHRILKQNVFTKSFQKEKLNEDAQNIIVTSNCKNVDQILKDKPLLKCNLYDINIIDVNSRDIQIKTEVKSEQTCTSSNKVKRKNVCIDISSSSEDDLVPIDTFIPCEGLFPSKIEVKNYAVANDRFVPLLSEDELPDLNHDNTIANHQDNGNNIETIDLQVKGKRELKKIEKQRAKRLKEIEREIKNNSKPDIALKSLCIKIDNRLNEFPKSEDLWMILQESEINYMLEDNAIEFSILWWRETVDCKISDDGEINRIVEKIPENQLIIIFPTLKFIDMVQDLKLPSDNCCNERNTLLALASHHKTIFPDKNITYVVFGVENFFRKQKNDYVRTYKAIVRGDQNESTELNSSSLSFSDIDEAVICLQVHEKINVHLVNSMSELGSLIISFTKAIAEAPYKNENKQNTFSWYAEGSCLKSTKIDSSGKGLLELWQNQLQQFALVSKDVAEAIVSKYPSPQSLLKAYEKCNTQQEAEKLLKDINVRRGIGPLATSRHVGPELSRKIYRFFTEKNEDVII